MYKFYVRHCRQTACEFFYANSFTLKALDKNLTEKNMASVDFWGPLESWGDSAA
jgi:hypothetical protein